MEAICNLAQMNLKLWFIIDTRRVDSLHSLFVQGPGIISIYICSKSHAALHEYIGNLARNL